MLPLNKDCLDSALNEIKTFQADMGITVLFPAMMACYDNLLDKAANECAQQIFLLTDGAMSNIRDIVQMAGLQKHIAEIHTFGIGEAASPGLVIELAEITGGSYTFALEHENINSKVVCALQKASRPNLIRTKVGFYLLYDFSGTLRAQTRSFSRTL